MVFAAHQRLTSLSLFPRLFWYRSLQQARLSLRPQRMKQTLILDLQIQREGRKPYTPHETELFDLRIQVADSSFHARRCIGQGERKAYDECRLAGWRNPNRCRVLQQTRP